MKKILVVLVFFVFGLTVYSKDFVVKYNPNQAERYGEHLLKDFYLVRGSVASLEARGLIEYALEDRVIHPAQLVRTETDWSLDRIDDRSWVYPNQYVYRYLYTGANTNVYVVDTGIRRNHPDFEGRVKKGYGRGYEVGCSAHGTYVAGKIAGSKYGVAPNSTVYDVDVFPDCNGGAPVSEILKGINWVIRHDKRSKNTPAVVNMSFATTTYAYPPLDDAVRELYDAGIAVSMAAGNYGIDACSISPARSPYGLAVSGFAEGDLAWGFNNTPNCSNCGYNYGACVDIYAPHHGFGPNASWGYFEWATDPYGSMAGTSMSSPHVAGVLALYFEQFPNSTPQEAYDAVVSSGTHGVLFGVPLDTVNLTVYSPLNNF